MEKNCTMNFSDQSQKLQVLKFQLKRDAVKGILSLNILGALVFVKLLILRFRASTLIKVLDFN